MPDRCRLCTANDHEAVVEKLAPDLAESRDECAREDAGPRWQRIFREFAEKAVSSLQAPA
jgi:hypothetical protein